MEPTDGEPSGQLGGAARHRWTALAVVTVLAVAAAVFLARNDGDFPVGSKREVTVDASECWRAFVEVGRTRWGSPSREPIPAAWGVGTETGILHRTSSDQAVFTSSADGRSTNLFGGEGEQFFDTACPLAGRPSP